MKIDIEKLITVDDTGMPKAPSITQLFDKDIRELYTRDETLDKSVYIKEVGVIYYLGNPNSPVRQQGLSDEECLKEAIKNFDLPDNYLPDKLMMKIIKRYYEQCITVAGRAIENILRTLHVCELATTKVLNILNQKLQGDITNDDINIILGLIDNTTKRAKDMPDTMKALNTAYENLRNEEETQLARGGTKILSSMDAEQY